MNTRLIIVEGLPGSGKSTLAARIADELKHKGKKVVYVDEGEPDHPADYANYDFPDFETERHLILQKWRAFANSAAEGTVYIFNCIFLQNPMCETMMRFDMDEASSKSYIMEIAEVIKELNPVIIYIDLPDVKATIDNVLHERGNGWMNAVIDYHTAQGYGKKHHLHGYAGYIKCLEERKKRELNILQALDIDHHIVGRELDAEVLKELNESCK